MNNTQYKFVVLDLDGTLTNSKKEITPRTLQKLLEVQSRGVKIVLASGRPTRGITPLADELKMNEFGGYILSYNGGTITEVKTGEVIFRSELPQKFVKIMYDKATENELHIFSYDETSIVIEKNDRESAEYEAFLTRMPITEVDSFVEAINFPPEKCLIVGDPKRIEPLEGKLNEEFGEEIDAYRSEPFYLEVVPKGIDKAKSLERLMAHVGGSVEEMIAIGDGYNDLSMIKLAGLGVAMGNAQDAVKEVADYITLTNEEDGVVAVIEKYL